MLLHSDDRHLCLYSNPIIDRQEIVHSFQVINDVASLNKIEPSFVVEILESVFGDVRRGQNFHNELIYKYDNLRLIPLKYLDIKKFLSFLAESYRNYLLAYNNVLSASSPQLIDSYKFQKFIRWTDFDKKYNSHKLNINVLIKRHAAKVFSDHHKSREDDTYKPEGFYLIRPVKIKTDKRKRYFDYKEIGLFSKEYVIFFWDIKSYKLPLETCDFVPYGQSPSIYFKRTSIGICLKSFGLIVPDYLSDLSVNLFDYWQQHPEEETIQNRSYNHTVGYGENEARELKNKLLESQSRIEELEEELEKVAKKAIKTNSMAKIIKSLIIDQYGEEQARRIQYFSDIGTSDVINNLVQKELFSVSGKTFASYFKLADEENIFKDIAKEIKEEILEADPIKYK